MTTLTAKKQKKKKQKTLCSWEATLSLPWKMKNSTRCETSSEPPPPPPFQWRALVLKGLMFNSISAAIGHRLPTAEEISLRGDLPGGLQKEVLALRARERGRERERELPPSL